MRPNPPALLLAAAFAAACLAAAPAASALDLAATAVFFRDQPGGGNVVADPAPGQAVYAHLSFQLDGAASGTLLSLEIDEVALCVISGSIGAGSYTGWCGDPWTATAGAHVLTGRVDPRDEFAESDESNNVASRNYAIDGPPEVLVTPLSLRFDAPGAPLVAAPAALRAAAPAEPLFTLRPPEPIPRAPAVLASRRVDLHRGPLARGAERLALPLPDGITYVVHRDGFERRPGGGFTWRGVFAAGGAGGRGGRALITLHRGVVAARLDSPAGLFELRTQADGTPLLVELDPALFLDCAGGVAPPDPGGLRALSAAATSPQFDPPDRVDLLGLYTAPARAAAGGVPAIEATLQAAVDSANAAFEDSAMRLRFRLVHAAEVGYTSSGDPGQDLDWVTNDPGVAALRDLHAADLVALLVEPGTACGIGWVMRDPGPGFAPFGFQVTRRNCAVGNLTFVHEHGHNLGMEHDPPNAPPPATASFVDSFGHTVDGAFRTVMAYPTACTVGCPRVGQFSDPDVLYAGLPTGVAGARDNARTGRRTGPVAANFRNGPEPDSFVIHNPGASNLTVEALVLDAPAPWIGWVPQAPFVVPAGGSQTVTVSVEHAQAPPGESVRTIRVVTDAGGPPPEVRVIVAAAGCEGLYLIDETVSGSEAFAACGTLTAGAETRVTASGDLTLASGSRVVLTDGFSVAAGGTLTVTLDPSLATP